MSRMFAGLHESGFDLHDSRLLPSPYASFYLFVHLLREKNRAAAGRLLADPTKLDETKVTTEARRSSNEWGANRPPPGQPRRAAV